MRKRANKRVVDENVCYICKNELDNEFYLIDGNKICKECFYDKHIAIDYKRKAKRIFV